MNFFCLPELNFKFKFKFFCLPELRNGVNIAENHKGNSQKKQKYVTLTSSEGQTRMTMCFPGRHTCECLAQKHALVNNCTECGRIVCVQVCEVRVRECVQVCEVRVRECVQVCEVRVMECVQVCEVRVRECVMVCEVR